MNYTSASLIVGLAIMLLTAYALTYSPRYMPVSSHSLELSKATLKQLTVNALVNASKHLEKPANVLRSLQVQVKALDPRYVALRGLKVLSFNLNEGLLTSRLATT